MAKIHPTAIVSKGAYLDDVEIGPYCIVEDDVYIGDGTILFSHVIVRSGTRIGKNNKIGPHVVLGGDPQDVSFKGQKTYLEIGDNNIIREFASIHRASVEGSSTVIGSNCFIMASSHIAHDCVISDNAIITSYAGISGYVFVGKSAVISGHVGIHQFVRIGDLAIVSGVSGVSQDVPPFALAAGRPAKIYGINVVGLKRAGFDSERRAVIKKMYDIFFRSGLPHSKALDIIKKELSGPDVDLFIDFVRKSKRGLCSFVR